ncbi:hypothetical protein DSM104443_03203 [Usitatibacter rugosus]|uniref:Thoeris protein ThsB TIR-like domain-containing protein n=1 Tax=Usitatibacter rugosus TaxID=2732067 RepID=A0A6M4GXY1_9PROT|nr:TIR domain-containing protein [Usitatibacter rugosus]QJR12119.1 hypothetical protein DSM104443_03203 [Usitatibacter rugosus]
MTKKQVKNVFVSHIHEDDSGLKELKALLDENGLTIRDYSINSSSPNNAKSETYIKNEILAPQISACDTLVVYISPGTKDSKYVAWEIEYAEKHDKNIVGVWAHGEKGCDVPKALADHADAIVGWHGTSIVDAITGTQVGYQEPDGSPTTPINIKRYRCS